MNLSTRVPRQKFLRLLQVTLAAIGFSLVALPLRIFEELSERLSELTTPQSDVTAKGRGKKGGGKGKKKKKRKKKNNNNNPPPTPTPIRYRLVSIFDMDRDDWLRYIIAVREFKRRGGYDTYVGIHHNSMGVAHGVSRIWPWHRAFGLYYMEELRKIDSGLTVFPYWPADHPNAGAIFTDAFIGGDGDPDNGYRVPDGPFSDWNVLVPTADGIAYRSGKGVIRQLNLSALPTAGEIQRILDISSYSVFRVELELLHNRVHSDVFGGDMRNSTSPSDGGFGPWHLWLDYIWSLWLERHGSASYSGDRSEVMPNIPGGYTAEALFSIKSYGYSFEPPAGGSVQIASVSSVEIERSAPGGDRDRKREHEIIVDGDDVVIDGVRFDEVLFKGHGGGDVRAASRSSKNRPFHLLPFEGPHSLETWGQVIAEAVDLGIILLRADAPRKEARKKRNRRGGGNHH